MASQTKIFHDSLGRRFVEVRFSEHYYYLGPFRWRWTARLVAWFNNGI